MVNLWSAWQIIPYAISWKQKQFILSFTVNITENNMYFSIQVFFTWSEFLGWNFFRTLSCLLGFRSGQIKSRLTPLKIVLSVKKWYPPPDFYPEVIKNNNNSKVLARLKIQNSFIPLTPPKNFFILPSFLETSNMNFFPKKWKVLAPLICC